MRGIIIAAGLGSRMGVFADKRPKCLLPIAGRSLFDRTVENLQAVGCREIVVIRGHKGHMIDRADVVTVENDDYSCNNILHSLMYARDYLEGPVVASYADIWVEPWIHARLMETPGEIVLAVDRDWLPYYENRDWHPVAEAENVLVDGGDKVSRIGKHLGPETADGTICGEFLGLWRMSARGTAIFRQAFEAIDAELAPMHPFQRAREWRKAYITDMVQHLVDHGTHIDCALIERGWAEFDTAEDYQRLPSIAVRQRLTTVVDAEPEG